MVRDKEGAGPTDRMISRQGDSILTLGKAGGPHLVGIGAPEGHVI